MKFQFALRDLLVVVVLTSLSAGLVLPAMASARKSSKKADCKGNLKQLGLYLIIYVARYGSDLEYPSSVLPVGAIGGGTAAGPNGAFWGHLWRLPAAAPIISGANARAISKRPGEDNLYFCKVRGRRSTAAALDYSGPNLSNVVVFPGGKLTERVRADTYIGGDLTAVPDPNHGGKPNQPDDDFNALLFDGSVRSIVPGSAEHGVYAATTTGTRT